jgi:hypothetical protein
VCAKGKFVAIASTTVETNNPEAELKAAFDLMGPIIEKYAHSHALTPTGFALLLQLVSLTLVCPVVPYYVKVHLRVAHAGAHR